MWRSLNLAVTSLHKKFHRLKEDRKKNVDSFIRNVEFT